MPAVSGSGTNSVTLTGTLTQINNLLAGNLGATASYIISSDAPPASDTLTLSVNDGGNTGSGGAQTGSDTATINISAVNDAPTATITPATYAATEQTSLTLHGTGLSIADVDAGSASVTATLSVVSGTLTVTAGTTGAAVSGSGSNSVTLTGTLTQINNLLAGNLSGHGDLHHQLRHAPGERHAHAAGATTGATPARAEPRRARTPPPSTSARSTMRPPPRSPRPPTRPPSRPA